MRQRSALFVLTAVVGVFALNACGSGRVNRERAKLKGSGSASVEVPLVMSEITSVEVVVSGAGISPDIEATIALRDGKASGLVAQIPAGAGRTFTVNAYRNVELVCTGSATTSITAGTRTQVSVALQCTPDPEDLGEAEIDGSFNFPPRIDTVVASTGSAQTGEDVSFEATASDADGDPVEYSWSAAAGSFSVADMATTVWTAPYSPGLYTVSVEVTDDAGGISSLGVDIDVAAACNWNVEGAAVNLSCDDGETIIIHTADYVCDTSLTCPDPDIASTTSISCLTYVDATCSGQSSCALGASNSNCGGEPCLGVEKALFVTWSCSP